MVKESLNKEYLSTKLETYIQDLINLSVSSRFPIAVVDSQNEFKGIIDPLSILAALTPKENHL